MFYCPVKVKEQAEEQKRGEKRTGKGEKKRGKIVIELEKEREM